jgi:hypothetical protein
MKRLHFLPFAWVIFALLDLDPDPADQNQCGSMGIHIHSTTEKNRIRDTVPFKVTKREIFYLLFIPSKYLVSNLGAGVRINFYRNLGLTGAILYLERTLSIYQKSPCSKCFMRMLSLT